MGRNIFKKNKQKFSSERGSLMIETLVGLTLITVGMLGILSLVSSSMKANHSVGTRFIAANLAGEGVEIVKNMVDTNVAQGDAFNDGILSGGYRVDYLSTSVTGTPDNCGGYLCIDGDGNYNHRTGESTVFKRTVLITNDSPKIIVNSVVEWTEGGEPETVNVEDHFYNWR